MKIVAAILVVLWAAIPAHSAAQAPPSTTTGTVYSCLKNGVRTYSSSKPSAGAECRAIGYQYATPPRRPPTRRQLYFGGFPCRDDCSGHHAGYDWAERRGLTDEDQCSGYSQSFIEGCWVYIDELLEEQEDEREDDYDNDDEY